LPELISLLSNRYGMASVSGPEDLPGIVTSFALFAALTGLSVATRSLGDTLEIVTDIIGLILEARGLIACATGANVLCAIGLLLFYVEYMNASGPYWLGKYLQYEQDVFFVQRQAVATTFAVLAALGGSGTYCLNGTYVTICCRLPSMYCGPPMSPLPNDSRL